MNDVTQILKAIENGDRQASEKLLPIVYRELRGLATQRLAKEPPGQTLQATALVHEAYVQLVENKESREWDSRGHFFGAAADAMRRILVDIARRKQSQKRGGDHQRIEIDLGEIGVPQADKGVLALDDALKGLAETDARAAGLVSLRFFAVRVLWEISTCGCPSGCADRARRDGRRSLRREKSWRSTTRGTETQTWKTGHDGDLYTALWQSAIAAEPDWELITSWNEWHEGTEIEPSDQHGDRYLKITAEYAAKFKALKPNPAIANPVQSSN